MTNADNIEKKIEQIHIKSTPAMRSRILADATQAMEQTINAQAETPSIRRIIMHSKMIKISTAAIIVILFLGFVPLNGTTAFGKVTHEVTSILSRLRAFMTDNTVPDNEYPSAGEIDKSVIILTTSKLYLSSEISALEGFLNEQNIDFVSADSGDAKYAVIPANTIDPVIVFLSSAGMKCVSHLIASTFGGQRAMITATGDPGQETKKSGAAIIVNKDDNHHLILDCAFDNTDNGCEVKRIKLATGEALLISGVRTGPDELMTILVLPEEQ